MESALATSLAAAAAAYSSKSGADDRAQAAAQLRKITLRVPPAAICEELQERAARGAADLEVRACLPACPLARPPSRPLALVRHCRCHAPPGRHPAHPQAFVRTLLVAVRASAEAAADDGATGTADDRSRASAVQLATYKGVLALLGGREDAGLTDAQAVSLALALDGDIGTFSSSVDLAEARRRRCRVCLRDRPSPRPCLPLPSQ